MVESKDVNDAEEKEGLFEPMACTSADNASEKKQKKWGLKNIPN